MLALGVVVGLVIAVIAAVAVLAPTALMHRKASPLERKYGLALIGVVAKFNSGNIARPTSNRTAPSGQEQVLADLGRNAYTGSCSQCHGANGDGNGRLGQATFPPAADLTSQDAKQKSDAELFWIVKNGLGFTGMPAFGGQYSDEDIWAIVDYLRDLQMGRGRPVQLPTPTDERLSFADIHGSAAQRGAALFFSKGCANCHGVFGEAPDTLALQDVSDVPDSVRRPKPGMPTFGADQLTDAEIADIDAYLQTGPPGIAKDA